MPWYKISVDHGPGHQSHSEKYVWSDEEPSKAEKEEWFENFARDRYMNYPIGKVLKCELPEKERLEKVSSYKSSIEYCKKMLKILGA